MKKIIALAAFFAAFTASVSAQESCMAFFPEKTGTTLVNKSYDANDALISTMTYTVKNAYDSPASNEVVLEFEMVDAAGNHIDSGEIVGYCENGNFYMDISNRALVPGIAKVLSLETEVIGDFIDYPDAFSAIDEYLYDGTFETDGGEFTIRSKGNRNEYMRVRVYGRQYEKNEYLQTPAGVFDAAKVSFDVEVNQSGNKVIFKGNEWYAPNAGIVRTEIYNYDNELQNYTELSYLSDK